MKSVKSLTTLTAASTLALVAAPDIVSAEQNTARPNVLLIVADDLGYSDISIQGLRDDITTPHIDSIARNGVRFTNGYVTNPLCGPSRAAILTGRYQQRFGFEHNPGTEDQAPENFGIPRSERLFSERLKDIGYSTAAIGKWHVGYREELQPRARGFDTFYGHLNGGHNYFNNKDGLLQDNGVPLKEVTYTTTMFGDYAVNFIRQNKDKPWGIYLPFSAVHGKVLAPESYLKKFSHIKEVKRRTLVAMMAAMDDSVGEIIKTLKDTGQYDNTLIIFISDNGGAKANASLNIPLRGGKGELYEGGIRIPFVMQFPGRIPAGLVYNGMVSAVDITPTIIGAVGLPDEERLDGVNLIPYLGGGKKAPPHQYLYWRVKPTHGWAIRQGDWKLFSNQRSKAHKEWDKETTAAWKREYEKNGPISLELYNLAEDMGETNNLAEKYPEKVKELEAAWKIWDNKNINPKWTIEDRKKTPKKSKTAK